MRLDKSLFVIVGFCLLLTSCEGKVDSQPKDEGINKLLNYSEGIQLFSHPSGWYEARIKNPWKEGEQLQTVALIPKGLSLDSLQIPEEAVVVRTPIENSLVTSTVHVGLIEELGASDYIGGVTDTDFLKSDSVIVAVKKGKVADCGKWLSPDIEKIMVLHPEAILLSPYNNGGTYGHLTELKIPVIYVADYVESDPLGRAEWIKYYGLLFGKGEKADSIFYEVEKRYNDLKKKGKNKEKERKIILYDLPQGSSWNVPPGKSYNDIFIKDGGGYNPFTKLKGDIFNSLSPEKVVFEAHNADKWIIRYNSLKPITLDWIKKEYPFASRIKAFEEREVWVCNTNEKLYFEETPFHPERLLEDLYLIINKENVSDSLRYFTRIH